MRLRMAPRAVREEATEEEDQRFGRRASFLEEFSGILSRPGVVRRTFQHFPAYRAAHSCVEQN
jgi:hypothetical protein